MYNIKDYGAVGDGKELCTTAIQQAIDACNAAGGGRIVIPSGIYKSGTIWLKSNVELHLEMGAMLLASDNLDDYNDLDAFPQNHQIVQSEGWVGKHLIIALEEENIAITGFGEINGNCYAFVDDDLSGGWSYCWREGITKLKDKEKMRPGQLICFIECTNLSVQDIQIINSPCWSCYLLGCEWATIRGIKVKNPLNMLNSDGIDIDTSRYVTVSDCIIHTGDDAITLRCCEERVKDKSRHCEYITVTNCVLCSSVNAIRVGVGEGWIRHACFSNLSVCHVANFIGFNTSYNQIGCAKIEDLSFMNISCMGADRLIALDANNGSAVRNITLEGIRAETTATSYVRCEKDSEMENIVLRNIQLKVSDRYDTMTPQRRKERGSYILEVKNGKRMELSNVQVFGGFEDCSGVLLTEDCQDLNKAGCNF